MARNKRARVSSGGGRGVKLLVLLFMGGVVYLAGALMDVTWIGARGRALGLDLRTVWGGALLIPVSFMLYLCFAWFRKRRVPRPVGQILGTLQLYISTAFMLGLFRRSGGSLSWIISEPGRVGSALAEFFFLNLGGVGTLLVAIASITLAAILFGVKLPIRPPAQNPATRERREHLGRVFTTIDGPVVSQKSNSEDEWRSPSSTPIDGLMMVGEELVEDCPPLPRRSARVESPVRFSPPVLEEEKEEEREGPEAASRLPQIPDTETISSEKGFQIVRETLGGLMASLESKSPPDPPPELPARDAFPPSTGDEKAEISQERWRKSLPLATGRDMETNVEPQSPASLTPEERARELRKLLNSSPKSELSAAREPDASSSEPPDEWSRVEFSPPPLDIFGPPDEVGDENDSSELVNAQAETIVQTLQNFGVKASVAHIIIGPSVIQFQLELAPGIKVSKVSGLANDLTMALAVVSVRVEAPILGQRYVGIEIPNMRRKGIMLRSIMESKEFRKSDCVLPLPMGVRVDSQHLVCGLEDMPHLLVAGTTGSGKSVFLNTCVLGMCSQRGPDELKLILVDPKHMEFAIYEGLPHLLAHPVSDPKKAVSALAWAVREMENRSEAFARAKVRNLASYNEKTLPKNRFSHIVVIVDELADLMYTAGKEVEGLIARLAQKARAAGIHLILATQRPSVDVITGLIKANVPARVAFAVPSQTDSRTIIDTGGAEKLLGKGDMLFYSTRYPRPIRLQASFITEDRTLEFVEYMKNAFGDPDYIDFNDAGSGMVSPSRGGTP
ncbi:MAG: DNA translocase FtsK [Synergistaceae bacterium]|jgi:S-DNA-T family DNA segregation ATPase FtsK/SpoIIIE|nr:DNA translocase FtsK [Synergistaceae bacterium]